MNAQMRELGWWAVRRHRRRLFLLALFALRHWRLISRVMLVLKARQEVLDAVSRGANDPRVRAEVRLATADLTEAFQRAREVGVAGALNDDRLMRGLRGASTHASKAATAARNPRRGHGRAVAAALVGTGLLAGAAVRRGPVAHLEAPRAQPSPVGGVASTSSRSRRRLNGSTAAAGTSASQKLKSR